MKSFQVLLDSLPVAACVADLTYSFVAALNSFVSTEH